jgi:hypothetical protein
VLNISEDKILIIFHTINGINKVNIVLNVGVVGYNYYYATTDANQYPKKIDENGGNIFDFNIYSYIEHDLDSKLFSVPSYCKSNCPAGSMCGKHQMTG